MNTNPTPIDAIAPILEQIKNINTVNTINSELLEALKECKDALESIKAGALFFPQIESAQKAIARAEGRAL